MTLLRLPARFKPATWFETPPLTTRQLTLVIGLAIAVAFVISTQPLIYAVGAIGAATVLLATLVRPELGLALICFSVPFGELVSVNVAGMNLTTTEPLIALVALAWVLRLAVRYDTSIRLSGYFVPFFLYLTALALATAVALSLRLSAKEMVKWGEAFLVLLMAANVLRRPGQVAIVVGALLAAGSLAAFQGFYQFFLRQGPEGFIVYGRFLRAYGTFGQPNPYGAFLALIIPIAFAILLVGLTGRSNASLAVRHPIQWLLSLPLPLAGTVLVFVGLCAALGMSLSRNAWFAAGAAILAIMALRSRRTFLALVALTAVGLVVALFGALDLLPPVLVERIAVLGDYFRVFDVNEVELTPENWSVIERIVTWQAAWEMFQTSIWYGVGPGNFQSLWPQYGDQSWVARGANPPHAHNYFLNSLAESGVVGLAGYIILIAGSLLYTLVRIRTAQRQPEPRNALASPLALALGGFGVLLVMTIFNLFDSIFVHGMTAQIGLTLGLVEAAAHAGRAEEGSSD